MSNFIGKRTMLIESGVLLNYAATPFFLPHPYYARLQEYPGSEWRFHAMKTLYVRSKGRTLHKVISRAPTAAKAKEIGRSLSIDSGVWDSVSYSIMLEANLAKFTQNSRARAALAGTGSKFLIEHRPDPIWGDNMDGNGANYMGKILMQVRRVIS